MDTKNSNPVPINRIPDNILSMDHKMDNILSCHLNGRLDSFYIKFYIIYSSISHFFYQPECQDCVRQTNFPGFGLTVYNNNTNKFKKSMDTDMVKAKAVCANLSNEEFNLKQESKKKKKRLENTDELDEKIKKK